ncbi:hypothetical protein ABT075_41055 [Streptomyces sp. NPDC002677]|uniref:hypothetical protein n=1 Tax=Streptomyces sp. NPDC002677 TaxID=3154774 RepID=UPI003333631C
MRNRRRPANAPVGSSPSVEGPYGAFTSLLRTRTGTPLIAEGAGITPVRAMLEEAPGVVVVLCRLDSGADAVQLNEVRHLVALRGGRLHLPTGGTGEGGTAPFGRGPAGTDWSPASPNTTCTSMARPP